MSHWQDDEIDVSGLTILDHAGHERIPVSGVYYQTFFAYELIDRWLPYYECHKCGRFDYCKYVELKPNTTHKAYDIKCGVVSEIIKNYLKYTSELFATLNRSQRQDYLDGLYHLTQYIFRTEIMVGMLMNKDFIEGFGRNYSPGLFGGVVESREILEKFAITLKSIPGFSTVQCYLLVEGQSEKAFVEQLKKGGLFSFYNIKVESYRGQNNKKTGKIQLLIEDYNKKGYKVFMQGDADGKGINIFQEHIRKELLRQENVFQFEFDFETAIPKGLLFHCLRELGFLKKVSLKRFKADLENKKGKELQEGLHQNFKVDINSIKIPLAIMCADLMYRWLFWKDKEFYKTELGRFVSFLEQMRA